MAKMTVAICTYNRAHYLPRLINSLRQQRCDVRFEILVVNNNSSDNTDEVLQEFARLDNAPLRFVKEEQQGIVHARNRAIEESLESPYLAFIDDDELPGPRWLSAAVDALDREKAECVGGEIRVSLAISDRPSWLGEELIPFLGEVKNGPDPFWITDASTPAWSGNIAYNTSIFSTGLRFDHRYNRVGHAIGGEEDVVMFQTLLARGTRMRYRPDMVIEHFIDNWRIRKNYFLNLHYNSGWNLGRWGQEEYSRTFCGIAPFMVNQAFRHLLCALPMILLARPGAIRQAMTAAHAFGTISGRLQRWRYA